MLRDHHVRHPYSGIYRPSGSYYKIIKANEAVQAPLPVRSGSDSIPYSDQVITQLLPLDNISVNDVQSVVNALKSPNGNIIAYNPTNTLIITDHAYNVRKVWEVINELDVGAPKAFACFCGLGALTVALARLSSRPIVGNPEPRPRRSG